MAGAWARRFEQSLMYPSMTFDAVNLLTPAILAVHNIEEYSSFDSFVSASHPWIPAKFTSRSVVRHAMILLTIAVAGLAFSTYVYRSDLLRAASEIVVCALMLNAVGHCALSLKQRKWTAGTLSAATLVLPFSIITLVAMRSNLGDSFKSILLHVLVGALIAPPAIASFLLLGYFLFPQRR